MSLKGRWVGTFQLDEPLDLIDTAGDELIERWSEPQRRYHTLEHLARMLDVVDAYSDSASSVDAVRWACWFHDAVYDPTRGDNEERSAALAASMLPNLGVAGGDVDEVARLVRLTATHEVAADDHNGALLVDADLAILGAEPEVYAAYAQQVRAEYAFVPDDQFRAGRTAILQRLLDRPTLYHLPELRQRWEAAARANVSAEIDALAAEDPRG